jgi:KaiC/GvpD/RAD55 family RecA-like ATPase
MFSLSFISEAKEQVLANLANFAYDPINYEFLRKLNVIDLFLDQLSEENTNFVRFGLAGLCNLALGNCASVYILVLKLDYSKHAYIVVAVASCTSPVNCLVNVSDVVIKVKKKKVMARSAYFTLSVLLTL